MNVWLYCALKEDITRTMAYSNMMYRRARRKIPGGVAYSVRYFEPYPFYARSASGSRIFDIDGNEYVDMWMGHGAIIMGHGYAPVLKAALLQIEEGAHLGFPTEWEIRHAEQISRMIPSAERVKPTNTGTEANMCAVRLARAYTSRKKVVKFEGHWHGGYDSLLKGTNFPYSSHASAGLHEGLMDDTVVAPFNSQAGFERAVADIRKEVACCVVEPIPAAGGFVPAERDFLKYLREFCDKNGSVLVFDEVVTGFRVSPGGAQQYYNIKPDLTVLGKIVGGSYFPAGALCGLKEIMERTDHRKYEPSKRVFVGGTYAGNPLTARAGYTLLSELEKRKDTIYPRLEELGKRVITGLEDEISASNVNAHVTGLGSLFCIHFTKIRPRDVSYSQRNKDKEISRALHRHMLSRGFAYLTPDTPHFILSYAHTMREVDSFVQAFSEFLEMRARSPERHA